MDECIFCKIVSKQIPAAVIYEDDYFIAFLDINPRAEGHTLVIPKEHYETFLDVPDELAEKYGRAIKHVAQHVVSSLNAKGFNVFNNNGESAGQVVKHVHFHILPRYDEKGHSVEVAFPVDEKAKTKLEDTLKALIGLKPLAYAPKQEPVKKQEEDKPQKKDENSGSLTDDETLFDQINDLPSP